MAETPRTLFWSINAVMFAAGLQFMLVIPMALPITMLLNNVHGADYVDANKGKYMTALLALPYLSGAFGSVFWGRIADRNGRRPVLLFGISLSILSMFVCATSTTYWQFAAGRVLSGLTDSTMFLSKAIVGDVTNECNQSRRFSDMMACFAFSQALFPNLVRLMQSDVVSSMPALLPCSVGVVLLCLSLVLCLLFVPETLRENTIVSDDDDVSSPFFPVFIYGSMAFLLLGNESLVPLLVQEKLVHGGLGYSLHEVSIIFTAQGVAYALLQKFLYPIVARSFGLISSLRTSCLALCVLMPAGFLPSLLTSIPLMPLVSMCLIVSVRIGFISLALTASIELLNNASCALNRARVSSYAQALASMARACGCVLVGTVYDYSRSSGRLFLPFCYLAIGMTFLFILTCYIPKSLNTPFKAASDTTDTDTEAGFKDDS